MNDSAQERRTDRRNAAIRHCFRARSVTGKIANRSPIAGLDDANLQRSDRGIRRRLATR